MFAGLGCATLFNFFGSFTVLAVHDIAALPGVLLGRILLIMHVATLRGILPRRLGHVSLFPFFLAWVLLFVPFGFVTQKFLL